MNSSLKNQTRIFNELIFEKKWVTKKSQYIEKFWDEIFWLVNVPKSLKKYVPAIDSYSLEQPFFIKYANIESPTIHNLFVCNDNDVNWKMVVSLFSQLMSDFSLEKPKTFNKKTWKTAMVEMYLTKTIVRLESAMKSSLFDRYFKTDDLRINGKKYMSGLSIINYLKNQKKLISSGKKINPLIESICLPSPKRICCFHGDLCFSNVFVNTSKKLIITIDPRGSFHNIKTYGDQYLEYAKISQSVNGLYDFIIEDRFSIDFGPNDILFKIDSFLSTKKVQSEFQKLFPKKDMKLIRLIESLQFLSMVPFHSDSVSRQNAFLLIGIKLFNESIK